MSSDAKQCRYFQILILVPQTCCLLGTSGSGQLSGSFLYILSRVEFPIEMAVATAKLMIRIPPGKSQHIGFLCQQHGVLGTFCKLSATHCFTWRFCRVVTIGIKCQHPEPPTAPHPPPTDFWCRQLCSFDACDLGLLVQDSSIVSKSEILLETKGLPRNESPFISGGHPLLLKLSKYSLEVFPALQAFQRRAQLEGLIFPRTSVG